MPSGEHATARRAVTAALRAGAAWIHRNEEERAWRELSRMHGVLLSCLPIGTGPATPSEMIDCLPKQLRHWMPLNWSGLPEDMGDLTVLENDDELTEQAFEAGMSYLEALYRDDGQFEPGGTWLPAWVRQTAEQTERATFRQIRSGSQAEYEAARAMLTEVPCGTEQALIEEYSHRRAPRMDVYEAIPKDRVFQGRDASWWWPCPQCAYPMVLRGGQLRCEYPSHQGRFGLLQDSAPGGRPPRVTGISTRSKTAALRAEGMLCVNWPVWRYITCPGLVEVALMLWLERQPGVRVERWENMDEWDIGVYLEDGWSGRVDVKDHKDPQTIIDRPPTGEIVVVPNHHRSQVNALQAGLDPLCTPDGRRYTVFTVSRFKAAMTKRLKGESA
ncbi:pPIWI_RE_Y domain-containing protein [Streptomyces parvus]